VEEEQHGEDADEEDGLFNAERLKLRRRAHQEAVARKMVCGTP